MSKTPSTSDRSAATPTAIFQSPVAVQGVAQSASQESYVQLGPKELIDILMKEYERLTQEIMDRINSRFRIAGYVGAVVIFVLTQLKGRDWPDPIWPLNALAAPKQIVWPVTILYRCV